MGQAMAAGALPSFRACGPFAAGALRFECARTLWLIRCSLIVLKVVQYLAPWPILVEAVRAIRQQKQELAPELKDRLKEALAERFPPGGARGNPLMRWYSRAVERSRNWLHTL